VNVSSLNFKRYDVDLLMIDIILSVLALLLFNYLSNYGILAEAN